MLPYERQLEVKAEQVDDALRRIGQLDGFELEPIVPAVEQWRYRNKLEYSFGTADDGELVCGFHAPGSWEHIEHVEDCLLASERGNEARRAALAWCREQGLGAYDRRAQIGLLRNLVVREGRRTGELQVRLVTSDAAVELDGFAEAVGADSVLWTRALDVAETTAGGTTEVLHGTEAIEEELGGLRFRISAEAFFQTNTEMAERLYAIAAEYAGLQGWERVYDLFCGIGTIGLSLAPRAGEVWGLEIVEEAIADAIANARRNEIDNARFFAGDVRLALRELVENAGRPDVLVVDPPRAGLSAKIVRRIIEAARRASSTSPATRRRSRPTPRSSSRPATRCAACARSTCSRRRRTSSAWRCSSARSGAIHRILAIGRCKTSNIGSNAAMRVRTRSLLAAGLSAAALSVLPATAGADGFPLVGWWPMNEGSGQVIRDWSGHGNNGTLGNSAGADDQDPAWIRGVFSGSALSFGGNDMVRIPDSTSLEPANVTVAAWIRGTSSPGQYKYVVGKGANGCNSGSYGLYTLRQRRAWPSTSATASQKFVRSPEAPTSIWDGKWHNAAGTFDGRRCASSSTASRSARARPSSTPIVYNPPDGGGVIGNYGGTCDLFFVGDVDGVQIWSRALPVADIWRSSRPCSRPAADLRRERRRPAPALPAVSPRRARRPGGRRPAAPRRARARPAARSRGTPAGAPRRPRPTRRPTPGRRRGRPGGRASARPRPPTSPRPGRPRARSRAAAAAHASRAAPAARIGASGRARAP